MRLAVPGRKERGAGVLLGAAKLRRGRLLDGRADGRTRGGGFARRVGEGWWRPVGIQLRGVLVGVRRAGASG